MSSPFDDLMKQLKEYGPGDRKDSQASPGPATPPQAGPPAQAGRPPGINPLSTPRPGAGAAPPGSGALRPGSAPARPGGGPPPAGPPQASPSPGPAKSSGPPPASTPQAPFWATSGGGPSQAGAAPPPRRVASPARSLPSATPKPQPKAKATAFDDFILQCKQLLPAHRPPKVTSEQMCIFTRQFSAMLDAGIPLHRALTFFAESGDGSDLNKVVDQVCQTVNSGSRLSNAMRAHPTVFSEVYCSLTETGEQSGQLQTVLNRLAEMLEKQVNMQKRLVATLTYPVILMGISMLSIFVFVVFVLPMIEPMFKSLKVELPLPTRMLLSTRTILLPSAVSAVVGLIGLWVGRPWVKRFLVAHPDVRIRLARIPLMIPIIGPVLEKIAVSRILYSLASMIDSGMGMVSAIQRSSAVAGNRWITEKMNQAKLDIMEGGLVSEAFARYKVFPSPAIHVIGVGEETSSITEMVRYAADMYDEEAELALDSMASMMEPVIMAVMGVVVGFVVLSAILPTLQLIQNL